MINNNLYAMLLKNLNKDYNSRLVSKCIILIKHSKSERHKQEQLFILYSSLSKLFIKSINNFFKLVESFPKERIIHDNQDIANECYIIMFRCVENLKVCEFKKFYYYLNTSLNRATYRLYEKNYKKHFDVVSNTEDNEMLLNNKKQNHHFDMSEIDLKDFSDVERLIIKFKISGEKLKDFLKSNKITETEYTNSLEKIKIRLIKIYE